MKNFLWLCVISLSLIAADRRPLKDYISGDAFRSISDLIYEEERIESWIYPSSKAFMLKQEANIISQSKPGSVIFVQAHLLDDFITNIHPKISSPYVLITHNGDSTIGNEYLSFIEDTKIIKWFAQNVSFEHKKLTPLPIGIENRYWFTKLKKDLSAIEQINCLEIPRESKAYLNINVRTYPEERGMVSSFFKKKPFILSRARRTFRTYLRDLKSCTFCLSPSGNGIDCHRTWEALLVGNIPIVRPHVKTTKSPAKGNDFLYEGLPVIVVDNWNQVNERFLQEKLEEFSQMDFSMEKLYFPFWKNLIEKEVMIYLQAL